MNLCIRPLPDRARLALLDATDRLEGEDLARWDAHLETCAACAERAALDAPVDARLAEAAASGPRPGRRPRRGLLVVGLAAAAAIVAAFVGLRVRNPSSPTAVPVAPPAVAEASRLIDAGRRAEALVLLDRVLATDRHPRAVFLAGHVRLHDGHPELAIPLLREAMAKARPTGAPDAPDAPFDRGYVAGHLAQALLASARGAEHDAEVERLVREEMTGTDVGASVNRAYVWADLAVRRAFSRGDVAGGEAALDEAEHENLVHRRETARRGDADLDCHYVLHARFAFAEGVHADSAAGRRIAADVRATKAATAASRRVTDPRSRDSFRADGLEFEAVAELLAARRGDPADLELARARLLEALPLRVAADNPEGLARVRMRLAWLDLLAEKPAATIDACLAAEHDARRSGAPEELVDARLLMAQASLALGKLVDAREALEAARDVDGATLDARRSVAAASIDAVTTQDEVARTHAFAVLRGAVASPLADVRRVAARALAAIEAGKVSGVGALDLGFDPRP